MAGNMLRIAVAAVALSTLSFAAGVAGDLSANEPAPAGQRVVLRIPPELPANTVRARPLPPLLATPAAQAAPARRRYARPAGAALAPVTLLAVEPVFGSRMEPLAAAHFQLVDQIKPRTARLPKPEPKYA